jgi:DNA processing protein
VDDVLAALGASRLESAMDDTCGARESAGIPQGELDSDAEMLLNALGFEPTDLDRLVERTGMSTRSVLSKLQLLELEGRVETLAGGRYSRTTARQAR